MKIFSLQFESRCTCGYLQNSASQINAYRIGLTWISHEFLAARDRMERPMDNRLDDYPHPDHTNSPDTHNVL